MISFEITMRQQGSKENLKKGLRKLGTVIASLPSVHAASRSHLNSGPFVASVSIGQQMILSTKGEELGISLTVAETC